MSGKLLDYAIKMAPKGTPKIEIPDAEHHVMIDQPLAFVAALRGLLAGWPR
jgi:pimeloyl-ACP methyl ester carboxylesterase